MRNRWSFPNSRVCCKLPILLVAQCTDVPSDLVERRLQLGGFKTVRLTGGMSPISRHNVITKFTNDPAVTVFLISLKAGQSRKARNRIGTDVRAGGVALNLVEASRVFSTSTPDRISADPVQSSILGILNPGSKLSCSSAFQVEPRRRISSHGPHPPSRPASPGDRDPSHH